MEKMITGSSVLFFDGRGECVTYEKKSIKWDDPVINRM